MVAIYMDKQEITNVSQKRKKIRFLIPSPLKRLYPRKDTKRVSRAPTPYPRKQTTRAPTPYPRKHMKRV